MNNYQKRRMRYIVFLILSLSTATSLILYSLSENINLYYTPMEVSQGNYPQNRAFRVGGVIIENSIKKLPNLNVLFSVTDYQQDLKIQYRGILPDLFKEGQGVVALGKMEGNNFIASQVLAKHDENYMPPEVEKSLKRG